MADEIDREEEVTVNPEGALSDPGACSYTSLYYRTIIWTQLALCALWALDYLLLWSKATIIWMKKVCVHISSQPLFMVSSACRRVGRAARAVTIAVERSTSALTNPPSITPHYF